MRLATGLIVATFTVLFGCNDTQQQASTPAPACAASSSSLTDASPSPTPVDTSVTFYGDLLPILSSNVSGANYKCTTCHAHYQKPDGLNNVEAVNRLVESLRAGRMPRGGDPVPDSKIELFSMWRLQGFKEGTPGKPSVRGQGGATPKSSSADAAPCQ